MQDRTDLLDHSTEMKMDQLIADRMAAEQIPGLALAIMDEDHLLFSKGYGVANLEHRAPVTDETVFEIASVTKLFTATAVMRLAEAGKLDIDRPISTYLPDLPPVWRPITIRQILAHQSGIKSYTETERYWETTRDDLSKQEILALVSALPLQFTPGQRVAYDNTGYYLLGLLIEAVSGQAYDVFLKRAIFDRLGMSRTSANRPTEIVPGRASGYGLIDNQLANTLYYSPSGTYSAGILLSTIRDLAIWASTLYTDRLLSAESRAEMWRPHPSAEHNEARFNYVMGLGWFLVEGPYGRFAGHNGSIVGFASSFAHFLDRKRSVILLCNQGHVAAPHEIAHAAAALL